MTIGINFFVANLVNLWKEGYQLYLFTIININFKLHISLFETKLIEKLSIIFYSYYYDSLN